LQRLTGHTQRVAQGDAFFPGKDLVDDDFSVPHLSSASHESNWPVAGIVHA
jgi:hypothetical protein